MKPTARSTKAKEYLRWTWDVAIVLALWRFAGVPGWAAYLIFLLWRQHP